MTSGEVVIGSVRCLWEALPPGLQPTGLCAAWRGRRGLVWLDSGLQHKRNGRFSFIGCDPYLIVRGKGDQVHVEEQGGCRHLVTDPFSVLQELSRKYLWPAGTATEAERAAVQAAVGITDGPDPSLAASVGPFLGGAVGYFGYGMRRWVENVPARMDDDVGLPDFWFGFYDLVAVFDHVCRRAYMVASGLPATGRAGRHRAEQALIRGRSAVLAAADPAGKVSEMTVSQAVSFTEGISAGGLLRAASPEDFLQAVERAKAYIAAGDIYQANLSQRFSTPLPTEPFHLYLRLREATPPLFGGFLDAGDFQILSASPERFLGLGGDHVETRPIKGTRPRGDNPDADARLQDELVASAKDQAEHVMIVDLQRNDLGRICRYGTVHVPEFIAAEAHPTVHHLVSTVVGRVAPERDRIECIRNCFPGGSITGAPKIRAMEIIDELEPVARGIYTGAMGYLGLGGEIDLNILIRTLVVRDGHVHFHVGGGIVADSDPAQEYQETLDKARGLMLALGCREAAETHV